MIMMNVDECMGKGFWNFWRLVEVFWFCFMSMGDGSKNCG